MIGRILKIAIGAVVLVAAGVFAWLFFAPGPLDFAGGETVALADYKGADPTGVPPSPRNASMMARGEYLPRAADCQASHTAPAGRPFARRRACVLPSAAPHSPKQ